jgi:hypothetical protein
MVDALRAAIDGVLVYQGSIPLTPALTKQVHGLRDKRNLFKWLPSFIWFLDFDI